jgi:hypothetical protein
MQKQLNCQVNRQGFRDLEEEDEGKQKFFLLKKGCEVSWKQILITDYKSLSYTVKLFGFV